MLEETSRMPAAAHRAANAGAPGEARGNACTTSHQQVLQQAFESELRGTTARLRETLQVLEATQQQLYEINNPLAFVGCNLRSMEIYAEKLLCAAEERSPRERYGAPSGGGEALDLNFFRQDIAALLAESRNGIARISDIVLRLCSLSRIDIDREWGFTDINASLENACDLMASEIGVGVEIVSELGELPLIECQSARIHLVFISLLSNAMRSVGECGKIWLSSGSGSGGKEVWVEVADSGCGTAPERLFEPFSSPRAIGPGMGLDLAVAYGIIEQHAGHLTMSSRTGGGSVFCVVLPTGC